MPEEFVDAEETEEVEVEETDAVEDEKPDRGDEVTVPEEEGAEGSGDPQGEGDGTEPEEEEADSFEKDEDEAVEEERKGVPSSRVSQISRQKSALQDIADGLMENSIDKTVINDLGGAKAVALAIAKGELQLSEVSLVEKGENKTEVSEPSADELWDEYNAALENLDNKEAKRLLKAARAADKQETSAIVTKTVAGKIKEADEARAAQLDYDKANEIFTSLQDEHPDLKNDQSEAYLDFVAMTNGLLQRMPYSEAVQYAAKKLLKISPQDKKEDKSVNTANKRKAAAVKKNAAAASQQPPSLAGSAGTKHNKKSLTAADLTEDEFDSLSSAEKKRMRGDDL